VETELPAAAREPQWDPPRDPPQRPVAVDARGWGWRHAGRRSWATRNVDLRIEPGERVLLLGASGAGKSTLLLGLAGLLDASGGGAEEGRLLLDGAPARRMRDRVGILFQDPETQLVMGRAGDDVAFGLENRAIATDAIWPRVDAALAAVDFPYGRERSTAALSGGERQRLALAGVLALRPGLLLLDEPTSNLDPDGGDRLREVLRSVLAHGGATMILVEHRVDEALPLVDRVIVLEPGGGLAADGDPLAVFRAQATALEAGGVWVPGRRVAPPPRRERPAPETLVLAENAGFTYPGAATAALVHAEAQVRSSEALAITGPNGSGKTTLALLLGGLLRPGSGSVVAGEALAAGHGHDPIWRWPAERLVRSIGTVFQEPEHQFLARSCLEELAIGPRRIGLSVADSRARAIELLERLRLAHLAAANPFTLSGGEKRRLSVATALATAPDALILDEPTFGQDRQTWTELLELLAGLRDSGRAVCFVTHDRDFANALADRTLRLNPLPDAA
jgi:energy-coupling factor transport system ATP-binding protein